MEKNTDLICQICGDLLVDPIVWCSSCGTAHHHECWVYNGKCSTYACESRLFDKFPPSSDGKLSVLPLDDESPPDRDQLVAQAKAEVRGKLLAQERLIARERLLAREKSEDRSRLLDAHKSLTLTAPSYLSRVAGGLDTLATPARVFWKIIWTISELTAEGSHFKGSFCSVDREREITKYLIFMSSTIVVTIGSLMVPFEAAVIGGWIYMATVGVWWLLKRLLIYSTLLH